MLEDHWHIACSSNFLKSGPKEVTLFSTPMALFRDEAGAAHAVEDRCGHRNMPLHRGKVVGGQLQCPYHGWCYGGDGELKYVPACGGKKPASEKRIEISRYPCIESEGYIWVCVSGNPVHAKPPSFPFVSDKGWTTFHMKTRFPASVENCLENFLDLPHATFVHKSLFRSATNSGIAATVKELADGAIAEYFAEPRKKSLIFSLLSNASAALKHTDRFIAPSMSRVDYIFSDRKHYIISSFCSPISECETEVFTVITYKCGIFTRLVRLIFEPLSRIIIKQDVKALGAQQVNIERFGGEKFTIIAQDLLRPSILRWRAAIKEGKVIGDIAFDEEQKDVKLNV